ncbi:PAS domain S-box protein [Bacillus sp. CGMCC 1.16607]|uniref:PAS domain S-box protein n=1 Tax=Bacillus sp. CGMCC 1.16607 TaxID=3351842 RepID=UPI0036300B87
MNNSNLTTQSPNSFSYDIFDKVLDGIVILNHTGIIIDVNKAFCHFVNLNKDQIVGQTMEHFVPKNKHYKLRRIKILLDQNRNTKGVLPIQHINGISHFSVITTIDENTQNLISVFRDITEKVNFNNHSTKYDYFFKELFIEAMDGIIFWDANGKIINANQAACRIFNCSYQELIGTAFSKFIHQKNKHQKGILKELFQTGAASNQLFILLPNGQEKLIEFTSRLHSVENFHMTIFRDVSERFRMELELRESEKKFRKIFEGSLEGLILWNDQAEIIDINESACKIFKKTREEIIGQSLFGLLPDINRNRQELAKVLENFVNEGKLNGTFTVNLEQDTIEYYEFSALHHLFSDVNFMVLKDVTEKLEMEDRLRKSDTLNVVGELAAGIAHEIRNPMTALKGFIQLLQGEFKEERSMYFQVILSELNRIDSIINEFLILAKPQVVKYSSVDLIKIMKETVELLSAQAAMYNVQFHSFYEEFIPGVYCESNQLKKVFVNMLKNAIEVMEKGGKITIKMERENENYIHISIKDEGMGIPEEKLKRLGEPFYTTKERGTGLGLMVSYKIIEEHKGRITVESIEGMGTTFHIYLPINCSSMETEKS